MPLSADRLIDGVADALYLYAIGQTSYCWIEFRILRSDHKFMGNSLRNRQRLLEAIYLIFSTNKANNI